jgi:hypothetical protein
MEGQLHKIFVKLVLILVASNWTTQVFGEQCLLMPPKAVNPVIKICENSDEYVFSIADQLFSYPKAEFQDRIKDSFAEWLQNHDESTTLTGPFEVELWMSVPEVNPAAAQPRVIIKSPQTTLSFWINLSSDIWAFRDQETAILGKSNYPDAFGYRPRVILVQGQANASQNDVAEALQKSGAIEVINQGSGFFKGVVPVFNEPMVAATARNRYGDIIKTAQVNSVMEWIADRQLAFRFSFNLSTGSP